MFGRKDDSAFGYKVIKINPSFEWTEDVKALNVSHRELEVFALLLDGHDNKEIGQILGIQYQSVKNHLFSLYKKLKAKNMAQAMKLLLFGNFITVEHFGDNFSWRVDREKWLKDTKWIIEHSSNLPYREELKKFLIDHGIYGELYSDRRNELEKQDDKT
ncbi:helix-turn-helix transcriptional regulator [Chloroflexota bacterium]